MKIRLCTWTFGLLLALWLASGAAFADPMVGSGTFDAGGTIYMSQTSLDFGLFSVPPPGDQAATILLPTTTGVFSYLSPGTVIAIRNLNLASATTTATDISFDGSEPNWITLPADANHGLPGIDLSLTNIPIDTSVGLCTGTAADNIPGTSCRPDPTSPLVLNQHVGSVRAVLNVDGNAYYVGSLPASGTLFNGTVSTTSTGADGTISGWLGTFAATGSITTSYRAGFATVPEPATLPAVCAGLFAIVLIAWKKRSAT